MRKLFTCFVMLFVGTLTLRAQVANNTSLVGTVVDSSGGVVVGAQVTGVNVATRVSYTGVTNAQGYYSIQFISPGTYDITVTDSGFQKAVTSGVLVQTNQAVRTNITLKAGSTSSTVTVSASNPALPTDSSFLGETFDSKQVADLPVMGHSALDVATVASNVYIGSKTSYTGIPPGEDLEGAGQREIQNSLSLDGVSIMNNLITTSPARPSTEMISEVQMQSGNYPAQYGAYLGIHVNMISKSGTNTLHGEAYDYVENTALNAKPFTLLPGKPTPILHWNQYGFNLGGPVYFPKVYNGRNKTFFFGSYEKLNNTGQNSGITSVLTPAMENGDFTALGTLNASGVCTGTCLKDPATGTYYTPNNVIPASELNSANGLIAQAYEKYMVAPNLPGITNNLNTSYPSSYSIKQTLDRVDENIGDHVHLFVRFHWQNLNVVSGSFSQPIAPTDPPIPETMPLDIRTSLHPVW